MRREELGIRRLGWLSQPASTGAGRFTVLEGTFYPGKGHGFHSHADQEELTYADSGTDAPTAHSARELGTQGCPSTTAPAATGTGSSTRTATTGPRARGSRHAPQ